MSVGKFKVSVAPPGGGHRPGSGQQWRSGAVGGSGFKFRCTLNIKTSPVVFLFSDFSCIF